MDDDTLVYDSSTQTAATLPLKIGKYSILKLLGRGGMGTVYLGKDPHLDRNVAIKTLLPFPKTASKDARSELLQRFMREAKSIAQLNHPNIVSIYSIGRSDNSLYLAMEYLDGATLLQLTKSGRPIPITTKIQDLLQICEGLNAIHEAGFVHRDVKPGNIMKTKDGALKIMDFGTVHTLDSELTNDEQLLGTPSYMSPEQLQYAHMDKRSDIFSLGAVIYFYLTGEKPFPGDSFTAVSYKIIHETPAAPSKLSPLLPKGLDRIVLKALAKNPDVRYASCKELAADLATILNDRTAATGPGPGRWRAQAPLLAACLALLLLTLGYIVAPEPARQSVLRAIGLAPIASPPPGPKDMPRKAAPPLAFQLNYLYLPTPETEFRRLRNGEALHKKDAIKIVFASDEDCYVYILRIDRGLDVVRLFPASGPIDSTGAVSHYANPAKKGHTYILPGADKAYSLENITGRQEIAFAASRTMDVTLSSLLKILDTSAQEKHEKLQAIYRFKTRMALKRTEIPDIKSQLSTPFRWSSQSPQSSFQQQRLENLCEDCVHRLYFTVQ